MAVMTVKVLEYFKREKVLTLALLLAAVSMFIVPPDRGYGEYMDLRVLALLFCLMLLVKGLQSVGLFDVMIQKVFGGVKRSRAMCRILVLLCFFTSMLITNDVALITFVPFAILTLRLCGQERLTIRVVVLQTIAANLGSMATPIGNPQNLYLFSASGMGAGEFLLTMLPLTALSLALILLATQIIPNEEIRLTLQGGATISSRGELVAYCGLFIVNLLVVLRVFDWPPALIITLLGVVALRRWKLLMQVDYALLITFVGFFVFVGNLGRMDAVSAWLAKLLTGREILVSALLSQVMSNVPAALLLSGFTENFKGLMLGTNAGGLGTLIASMASLISYKLYAAQPNAEKGKYFAMFTLYNVAGLILLLGFCALVY